MLPVFIPHAPLPIHRPTQPRLSPPRPTPPHPTRLAPTALSNRTSWPLTRFLQTAVFYSPLGRFLRFNAPDPAAKLRQRRQRATARMSSTDSGVVLVTGANGGTGRRVVRELLKQGFVVRALTRRRDRLEAALRAVGLELEEEESAGRIEVFVSDLFNVREEMFERVVGVVSCTGVNVGPVDDPDRSKYFQGLKFYEPTILEDSPENVEYVGVRNLVEACKAHFSRVDREGEVSLLEFGDVEEVRKIWGGLDDVVMGGVSESFVSAKDGALVFGGRVRTENSGGFCSVRTTDFETPLDLSGFDGIRLRVRGDGQRYKMIVRCEKRWDGTAHCFSFSTTKGELTEVDIPFEDFNTVFRAKTLPDGPKINPANVYAFQLMLSKFEYDGNLNPEFEAGPFELKVEAMVGYNTVQSGEYPRMVFQGSAGVTRVFRKDEIGDLEKQPPAVRMNEALGRILEWKLAGEDVVRTSGLPYCIIRPCALTEKEAVGVLGLRFEQGDNITGQISREDVAPLLVAALKEKRLVGKTVEVSWGTEAEVAGGTWEEVEEVGNKVKGLSKDEDVERTFAEFPFVPKAAVVK